jgi:hypothetical protein
VSCIFPSNSSFSRRGPSRGKFPSLFHRSGSLRSRFPCFRYYDRTRTFGSTTAHRPSRSLLPILPVLKACPSFVSLFFPSLCPLGAGEQPGLFIPAYPLAVFMLPETMSSHMFPCDLLYICPAHRPRLRCSRSLNARSRSLPLTVK